MLLFSTGQFILKQFKNEKQQVKAGVYCSKNGIANNKYIKEVVVIIATIILHVKLSKYLTKYL